MGEKIVCLLLGAVMGAVAMGAVWVIMTELQKKPKKQKPKWVRHPDGWIRQEDDDGRFD